MRKFYILFFFATFVSVNVFATTFPITVVVTPASCGGTGTIIVTPLAGTAPYMYSVDGSAYQVSNVITGLPAGVHVVIVMDSNGDTGTQTITILGSPALTATLTSNPATCAASNGSIEVTVLTGTSPYSFSLDGGITYQPSNIFNNIAAGNYIISVADAVGCSIQLNVTVSIINTVSANAGSDTLICAGTSVQLHGSGGTTFLWTPSVGLNNPLIADPIATPAVTTIYQLTVSDGICTSTDSIKISVAASAVADAGPDKTICFGNSVQLSGSGGSAYSWTPVVGLDNPTIANPIANPLTTTTYQLTVSNGMCSSTDVVVVFVDHPVANAGNDTTICLGSSVPLTGTGGILYTWVPGNLAGPVNTVSPIITTEYYLTIIDAAGCVAIDSMKIIVQSLATPLVSLSVATLTVTNPDASATYTWQVLNGSVWEDIVPAANGISYTATTTGEYRVKAESGACTEFSGSMSAGRMASGNEFGIYLYPNPTTGQLILDEMRLSQGWEILDIINSQGMKVLSQNIQNRTSVSVNVSTLRAGIYTAKLKSADGRSTTFRFVKQ